jgi:DNA polymerase III subunit gamma/tau
MTSVALNLSRKWRSQDFDHIVGQELAIRILKNSLYLGHYFPVYLFAGQRGCGKTSTARIFAAAVNCRALDAFQANPKKSTVPCLVCDSCIAMKEGNHPDFIEIDAASHTGVDNIRGIIESSSLLPLMGRKRVYLIDEAHMLSKAAFNAALKILEEPPATALFILATTNPHKIIDTVRSRCFQLFFTALPYDALKKHLHTICASEEISCEDDALDLIVRHTGGSARDALNLLEQVRFSSSIVSRKSVLALLGHIDDQVVINLIQLALSGSSAQLVQLLDSLHLDSQKAEFLWQRMVILLRALLWIKHGVRPHELVSSIKLLEDIAQLYSLTEIHSIIEAFYAHEELFAKTIMQQTFLEVFLLDFCNKKKDGNGNNSVPAAMSSMHIHNESPDSNDDVSRSERSDACPVEEKPKRGLNETVQEKNIMVTDEQKWQHFVSKIEPLNEPLILSVFKQARFVEYVENTQCVSIELSKDFILFKEWLDKSKHAWHPLLGNAFGPAAMLDVQFTGTQKAELIKKTNKETVSQETTIEHKQQQQQQKSFTPSVRPYEQSRNTSNRYGAFKQSPKPVRNEGLLVDVSDETRWKKAALLLRHFPGVVTEMRENQ